VEIKKIYFAQPWGGLGDSLGYSNLPRLYKEKGIPFQVSFLNYSRNREIHNLVWKQNKFVDEKVSFRSPNAGYVMFNKAHVNNPSYNIVQTINALHGFEPGNGYPEIHIKNPNLGKQKLSSVADLNAYSLFNTQGLIYDQKYVDSLRLNLSSDGTKILDFPNIYSEEKKIHNSISITSIDSLVSTLLSTDVFYCLNSGSHTLAAALKNSFGSPKKIVSFLPDSDIKNLKDWGYIYDNVEYKITPSVKNLNPHLPLKMRAYKRTLDYLS
tara:strand:+ start:5283 stop:6086 length:804 start_codon:yes stop_codon:yes gene_type:complete